MRLKNRQTFPPGGWQYFQPETGWSAPFPMADNFDGTVRKIIEHRRANPRFNLSTDIKAVGDQLELFTIHRIKFDPHYVENEAQKKTRSSNHSSPVGKLVQSLNAQFAAAGKLVKGAKTLAQWVGDGGIPVSRPLAQNRANTCLKCPLNDLGNWTYTNDIAEMMKAQREVKTGLNLTVANEDKLGTCAACGCHLPLKVWVPLKHIKSNTADEEMAKLHEKCWVRTENDHPILVVLPFCQKDYQQALKVLGWIKELGGCKDNPILLMADFAIGWGDINRLAEVAKASFSEVHTFRVPESKRHVGWPKGPNWMFENTLRHVYANYKNPFYWLEPDCIPIKKGWLKALEEEYRTCGKPFMGAIVSSSGQANVPGDHLTGCAIYPNNAIEYLEHIFSSDLAFDMTMAATVVPFSHNTKLHSHWWGQKDLAPVFKRDRSPDNPRNTLLISRIPKEAVIHHRDKTGSLIDLLRITPR